MDATHFQKYVIQSVFCERLLNYVQYVQNINLPRAADHDETIYSACLTLLRYDSLDQRSYYTDFLVPLLTKMNRQRQETGPDRNEPPPHIDDYHTYPVLPHFCIKNDYPYHVHIVMYACYDSRYEAAIRIVRSLCSGFKELEMNQSIGYNCTGDGIVYDTRKNSDVIYIPNSEIDIQILSTDDINSLYEIIFHDMLSNDYRIIIYNHADYNPRRKPDIYSIIRCGTPPYWNTRYYEAPVRAFTTVLQNFRNYVCDTATMYDVTHDYIDRVCQQVLLRLVYSKYKRNITSIPSDLCIDVLPQELLNLIPTDVLSQLPTNELFDPRAEPRYVTTINSEIRKIITTEIAIPSSWFGDNRPRQVGKKLSQDDTAQVDIHWISRIDDYFGQHHQTPEMKENIDRNTNKPTAGMSEEATRLVAYALSKMQPMEHVTGLNFDSDTALEQPGNSYMNEVRHETDVQMDDVHVCGTTEQQPFCSQNDQNDDAIHQDLPHRQQTSITASDIDGDNDAALFYRDDIYAKSHTRDADNDNHESDEFYDDDDDTVVADVCDGDEVDEEDGQQYLQQHTVGSNIDDAIDIDDDENEDEDDEDEDDDESTNDYDERFPNDGGDRERVEDNIDNEMDVDDETETENMDDDDSTEEDVDVDESANEDADDDIEDNFDEENKYEQEEHYGNEHSEEDTHHAALPARGDGNGIEDNIEQTEQRSANAQEKDGMETRANELDFDDDNGGASERIACLQQNHINTEDNEQHHIPSTDNIDLNVVMDGTEKHKEFSIQANDLKVVDDDGVVEENMYQHVERDERVQSEDSNQHSLPTKEVVKNIEGAHSEEFHVEDRSKEHVSNSLVNPKMKVDLPPQDAPVGSQSKAIPAIGSDVNESVPLGNATISELSSLQLGQNDPEAGYEAEDSQDAGTDDDDNEYQNDASVLQDGSLFATNMSSTIQAAAADLPMVEHKAVSSLIDIGYEPDTQEGRTDVDFIHHIDPEAGYEAEDSQDAGTEEENDDHQPSMEVTSGDPSPEPILLSVEPSTPSTVLPSHQEDALSMVDQGYEPDPESQGQTDVDGVPQQLRHMESGYDGEESQCHTEDDIHTEDEHHTALPSDIRWQDAVDKTSQQQLIRPAASADGMIADDEMEAESSEVEMADGGSSSLKLPSPALNTTLNKDIISGTTTGNLLTQIATNIQNEHSNDSFNVSNPHNETTARRIEYDIPPIDGDDEEEDESSDSVRSKPGDEISCPMSETHSSQSSVGMRSAAKSAASGEASQPNTEAVPILEIRTTTNAEPALPSPMKLTGKRNATSAKKPPKPPKKVAEVGKEPLIEKRSTRSTKTSGTSVNDTENSHASYKKPPLIKRSTRSTNASVTVPHDVQNKSSPAGSLKDPSTGKLSTTGMSTKEVENFANGTQSISPPNITYQKPPLLKRLTRSSNASATTVNDTQNLSSQTVSDKETPTRKLRSTRSTPSGANTANDAHIASSPTLFNKETPTGKRSTRSTQAGVTDEPPAKKRSTRSTKASTGTAIDDTHSTTSSNVSNRRMLRSTSAAQIDTPSSVLRPPANERLTRSTNAKSLPSPSPSVASTRSKRSRK